MEEIIKRINVLIKKCRFNLSFAKYQRINFEIYALVVSLFGENSFFYGEYESIIKAKITSEDKGRYFAGFLQAIKNHLLLQLSAKKRYQVFISSTYQDLIPYREAVSDCVSFCDNIPAGMENFKANKSEPFEYIKRVIDESDYYILLLGQRYGSIQDTEKDLSFTFSEYVYALEKKKPVLLFVYNGTENLPANDLDKYGAMFDAFKKELLKNHTAIYFDTPDKLKLEVIQSLNDEIKNNPQKGWIRL